MKKIILIILLLPLIVDAQITLVKDNFQQINAFMQYKNQIFFYAYDGTNQGLWKTDGTTAGTVFVKTIYNTIEFSGAKQPAISGGLLYFTDGGGKLWRTDGTSNGTFELTSNLNTFVFNKIDLNGILIFTGRDADGDELWRTDGTLAGTYKIVDFNLGASSGVHGPMYNMAKQGNYVYFAGVNASYPQNTLCRTDGTAAGTQVVPNAGFAITDLAMVGDKIVYVANVNYTFHCVGTLPEIGTASKKTIMKVENGISSILTNPGTFYAGDYPNGTYCGPHFGADFGNVQIFRKSGNKLFFKGTNYPVYNVNNSTAALWVTDGISSQLLKIFPPTQNFYNNSEMEPYYWSYISTDNTFLGGIFYFVAGDDNTGHEVWRSDGTVGGTFLLKDIYPGFGTSEPKDFRTVNGITYFVAGDGTGRKLFQTDGTTVGTFPVANPNNVNPYESPLSSANSNSNRFSNVVGSKFLFVGASNQISGDGLFAVCTTPQAPALTSNVVNNTVCFGGQTTLTATGCNGSVSWNTGATTSTITVSPTSNTTYTSNCNEVCGTSPSSSITINVNPLPNVPTLNLTGTQVICPNTNINLTASSCNGSLLWSNGATASAIIVNSAGTYNATCTNTCGTSLASSAFVLAYPNLTQNLSGIGLNGTTKAIQTINSTQSINNGINTTYLAGKSITLNPNFTAKSGAVFKAEISTCAITAGLVAYYNMNNNVDDQSGNGHHTTYTNTTVTTGRKGDANGAYSFNGINQRINLGGWFNLQEFTISMWLNAAATQNNSYAMIFDNNHGFNISFNVQQDFNNTNQYYFGVGGSPTYGYSGFSLTPNQWEHIVLVKGNGFIKVYKNGVLLGSATHSGLIDYTSTVPSLCLGAYVNNNNYARYWAGKMDDIKIYNRAISDVEVSYLFSE